MFSKEDLINYTDQMLETVKKMDQFYSSLYSKVEDRELKEFFLRLQSEEKSHVELIQKLKDLYLNNWQD